MHVDVRIQKWKELPDYVFSEDGGREAAKKRHKVIRKRIKDAIEKIGWLRKKPRKLLAATTGLEVMLEIRMLVQPTKIMGKQKQTLLLLK